MGVDCIWLCLTYINLLIKIVFADIIFSWFYISTEYIWQNLTTTLTDDNIHVPSCISNISINVSSQASVLQLFDNIMIQQQRLASLWNLVCHVIVSYWIYIYLFAIGAYRLYCTCRFIRLIPVLPEMRLLLWCLMPLSRICQLCRGGQFNWCRKPEYPEKTTSWPSAIHCTPRHERDSNSQCQWWQVLIA